MKAWLTSVPLPHLLGIAALIVLLSLRVGPQETELAGLFGLVGLAIPTTTSSST